ncbi:hypothetical protein [Deinococcus yunweiensis]|uniref:hypothetical protein n=1 Tax=Deinococcus yunweiensis TaxID=367282 RepID=UPI00398E5A15
MSDRAPLTMTEREAAREQLRASIDALSEQASLHVQMQKDPLKMLGGASAVGAVIGMVVGRQFRRSRKIYVDAGSPEKHQKALIRAQKTHSGGGGGIGGALVATLGTLAVKTLTDKVITPRLEGYASSLLERSGTAPTPARTAPAATPAPATPARPFTPVAATPEPSKAAAPAQPTTAAAAPAVRATHPGVLPHPPSVVEAKAEGSVIPPEQMSNPNRR